MRLNDIDYSNIHKELLKIIKPEERVEYYNCYTRQGKKDVIKSLSLRLKDRGYTLSEIARIINSLGYKTHCLNRDFTLYTIRRILIQEF